MTKNSFVQIGTFGSFAKSSAISGRARNVCQSFRHTRDIRPARDQEFMISSEIDLRTKTGTICVNKQCVTGLPHLLINLKNCRSGLRSIDACICDPMGP
ncbi:unnamed protein product [Tenebrio molitor]|nr:unnamed protein product [Tenebrio molitor]